MVVTDNANDLFRNRGKVSEQLLAASYMGLYDRNLIRSECIRFPKDLGIHLFDLANVVKQGGVGDAIDRHSTQTQLFSDSLGELRNPK